MRYYHMVEKQGLPTRPASPVDDLDTQIGLGGAVTGALEMGGGVQRVSPTKLPDQEKSARAIQAGHWANGG